MEPKRRIEEVLDLRSGEIVKALDIFQISEEKIFKLRRILTKLFTKDRNILVCPYCLRPVYISGTPNQSFVFKHRHELGDCPIKTKGKYSQDEIDRMRYNGIKESDRHRSLKNFIYNTLDNDHRFNTVEIEKVIKGGGGLAKEWRKPDVSSKMNGKSIVWEIQPSTTYHNVIVARENFYLERGIFIIWIFNEFDPNFQRFTQKDIYWENKANAFVVNKQTMELSKEKGELILCCHYIEPYLKGTTISHRWRKQNITIDDLIFDPKACKVFFYDKDAAIEDLNKEIKKADTAEFENYFINRTYKGIEDERKKDEYFCQILSQYLSKPITRLDHNLSGLLAGIYSAKHGRSIGFGFDNPLSVANNMLEHYKMHTKIFTWALHIYGQEDVIRKADRRKGTFKDKIKRYKENISSQNPDYIQSTEYNEIISLLFPELIPYLPSLS